MQKYHLQDIDMSTLYFDGSIILSQKEKTLYSNSISWNSGCKFQVFSKEKSVSQKTSKLIRNNHYYWQYWIGEIIELFRQKKNLVLSKFLKVTITFHRSSRTQSAVRTRYDRVAV